ncbi:MAG: hypothetical protein ACAI35_23040 [Candidatus Methylacidiphilales bacterium]|nr:hypothetical protein [Candidatus Methylacidiphilales bacterium]
MARGTASLQDARLFHITQGYGGPAPWAKLLYPFGVADPANNIKKPEAAT